MVTPAVPEELAPPPEDRAYLAFVLTAILFALGAGLLLAVLVPLTAAGRLPWAARYPQLLQAHGWSQLLGWAGVFVTGMGLRLAPRFVGARTVPARAALAVLALVAGGVALRVVGQSFPEAAVSSVLLVSSGAVGAAGMLLFAILLAFSVRAGRRMPGAMLPFVAPALAWWAAWAVLWLIGGIHAAGERQLVPGPIDGAATWVAQLGAIGNFIWAVQGRTVPVFFGRRQPPLLRVLTPAVLLNAGLLLVMLAMVAWPADASERIRGVGLAMAGVAIAWLAPVAGAVSGRATRLRPRSRAAARFVLAANLWAVLAGALLAWAGVAALVTGDMPSRAVTDAARHAFGVGVITMLIVGMAILVAPIFALERAEAAPPGVEYRLGWPALVLATLLRVIAALLQGHIDERLRLDLVATSGVLAWLGVASFAWAVLRARLKEPRMKALLIEASEAARRGDA